MIKLRLLLFYFTRALRAKSNTLNRKQVITKLMVNKMFSTSFVFWPLNTKLGQYLEILFMILIKNNKFFNHIFNI